MSRIFTLLLALVFALVLTPFVMQPLSAQSFNPDANADGLIGVSDITTILTVYGQPFSPDPVPPLPPSVLHFDPDTMDHIPLGYDLYIAEDFIFPYLYVSVPPGEFPGQTIRMTVSKQPDQDSQSVYLQDLSGNWLTYAQSWETNGIFAELIWTGTRWVSGHMN
ncbi:MAG: hypothetical protein P8M07_05045 [Flavobacteriales bacterium]|nr:hypothetical protein [Flavobacteriales bacterium]